MAGKKKRSGSTNAGNGSIVIGGNVDRSNIVAGNNNMVSNQSINIAPLFETIYHFVETNRKLQAGKKQDAKEELQEIQAALEEPKPDENFITRRFRNLKRMAPEIVEVVFETLKNPVGGVSEVIKRISKKMAEEANT
ncbi:MAG: hypothetical protein H7Y59_10685 [Anaerolineales bacterium]|nr:hypothetical protein [Anaerolineales bacterium]